jgi:4,5-DOPA dioxygenase extradiol
MSILIDKVIGFKPTTRMPVLFLGHGSPMNAIEENEFVQGFRNVATQIPKPKAILCISAHWETRGTLVTAMEQPRTIHDFGGFPPALYAVQYPAKGSPDIAEQVVETVKCAEVGMDLSWGLDHGCWSVVKHLYPLANIPVLQMSLNVNKTPREHFELAKELAAIRKKGVLIVGSGNVVHNLGLVAWDKLSLPEYGYDWAIEANEKIKGYISNNDHQSLYNLINKSAAFMKGVPTLEHYLPLLYALALKDSNEQVQLFNDRLIGGSLSMLSVLIE